MGRLRTFAHEFWLFDLKQAWACLFAGLLLFFILLTQFWYPFESLYRYDFLFILAVLIQLLLLAFRLETPREVVVIVVFHMVATGMVLFKTSPVINSWRYPGEAVLTIGNVPLFAGFMYSAVGSYIARIWRIFEFRFSSYPPVWRAALLALLVYINLFSHHYVYDIRWWLVGLSLLLFGRVWIHFRIANATDACRWFWAFLWWRCLSGLPRTWRPTQRSGSIRRSTASGLLWGGRRLSPGIC